MPFVLVYSQHPLASEWIERVVHLCVGGRCEKSTLHAERDDCKENLRFCILDTLSIPQGIELLLQSTVATVKWIALVPGAQTPDVIWTILRLLHLGVFGIVGATGDCAEKLEAAILAVSRGKVYAAPALLSQYVRHRAAVRSILSSASDRLTARELQVLELILWGFSNKHIAIALKLSKRTVKFHVGNILGSLTSHGRVLLMNKRRQTGTDEPLEWAS